MIITEDMINAGHRILIEAVKGMPLPWIEAIKAMKPYLPDVYRAMAAHSEPEGYINLRDRYI